MSKSVWVSILVSLATATVAKASANQKKYLTISAYQEWHTIEAPQLSNDGRWVAYTLASQKGQNRGAFLVVRSLNSAKEFRVPRGNVSEPPCRGVRCAFQGTVAPTQFTADSRFVVFTTTLFHNEQESPYSCASAHRPFELGIMSLASGSVIRVAQVASFTLPKRSGKYIGYMLHHCAAGAKSGVLRVPVGFRNDTQVTGTLVIRNLEANTLLEIENVMNFEFDNGGNYVAYSVASEIIKENGVYVRHLDDGQIVPLATGSGDYHGLTFDEMGEQLSFLTNRDEYFQESSRYSIYYTKSPFTIAKTLLLSSSLTQPLVISKSKGVKFVRAGNALTFWLESDRLKSATQPAHVEESTFDLWHWKDSILRSEQKIDAHHQRTRSYLAVYHIALQRWAQLGSEGVPDVLLSDDARHAVGVDHAPYIIRQNWGDIVGDVYYIDVNTGKTSLVLRELYSAGQSRPFGSLRISPGGKYLIYFDNRQWFSYDFERRITTNLTGALLPKARFETSSSSTLNRYGRTTNPRALPEGIAGWTAADKRLLIYDQYDIWQIDPTGVAEPMNLTGRIGKEQKIVFRHWPHSHFLYPSTITGPAYSNSNDSLLLTAFNEQTKASGLWRAHIGKDKPESLLMLDKRVQLLAKAHDSKRYLMTQETFAEYPDLWVGDQLGAVEKISNANPQQQHYSWGSAELVNWTSNFGAPLQGVLYKPVNFDSSQRHPMIVTVYNGPMSDDLHEYPEPRPPSAASIDFVPLYLSKGYVVFKPDTRGVIPYPGESALAAIVPGVQSIIDIGVVDPFRICLVGHSHGGYQTAFVITHTHLFRCAIESAGPINTISRYSDLDANGRVKASYYERGNGLHGASIWEEPLVYLSNSPFLFADRIKTPVLMMYNEDDESVSPTQGIEFYIALRRNGKEAYLLNYHDERHDLVRYANRMDWDRRMQEFLDHFLMDRPKPRWMENPILETLP